MDCGEGLDFKEIRSFTFTVGPPPPPTRDALRDGIYYLPVSLERVMEASQRNQGSSNRMY